MTVQTTSRRQPSGRTVTSRHRPPTPTWLRVALWAPVWVPLVFWLGHQVGSAFDGKPAPTPYGWEVGS